MLTQGFGEYLRRRRVLKHFGRHPLLDALGGHGSAQALPEHLASDLLLAARDSPATAIARLQSHDDYCVLTTVMKRYYVRKFGWQ